MNKFYTLLPVLLLTSLCRLSGQTPGEIFNGDFENWATEVYFEFPATWFTQTDPDLANLTTFREDNAMDGNYSLRLVTVEYEQDTVFGFAVQGMPQEFPPRGIPWSQTIDTLHFWMRSGVENGDAVLLWVMLSKDGTVVSNHMEYFTESYSDWTHVKIGVNEGLVQPDSLFFGIASSAPPDLPGGEYSAVPGTWVMIDNVYFTLGNEAQQYKLPNHSFETWNEAVVEDPEGWTSNNLWLVGHGLSMVTKTTDAYSGDFAARLEVIEIDGHTASGRLFYGEGMWEEGGAPFTGQPEYLSFVVKYDPAENDQADLYYVFSNQYGYNMSNYMQISSTGGEFVHYHLPVDLSFQPDSLRIDINSGNNPGSVLIIDKITTEAPVCGPYDVPFREKFDLQPSPHIPVCWEATGAGDYYSVNTETYNAYSKPNCLMLSSNPSSLAMLVSPEINADMNQLRIKFFARAETWIDNKELHIGTVADPEDPSGFTLINTLEMPPEWQEFRINLDAYAGTDKYLAFKTGDLSAEDYARVYLDNITVMFIPLCPEPEDLYTDNITPYTASLHWSEKGTATEWDILWGPAGFDPDMEGIHVENITENPYQMTGLDAGTRYQVHVRSHCGAETSDWSLRHVFETECVPIGIPFHENFDEQADREIPLCWTISGKDPWDVMVVSWWKYSSSPNSVKFYHSGEGVAILATPEIDVDISTLRLSFYAARYNSYHKLTVGTITDPQDPDSFTPFKILELTDNMQEFRVYFDGFSGPDRYIAFWYGNYGESGGGEILVDDIMIEYAPLCREPGELFADIISASSASLHWTEKGTATTWDILWGKFGFDPETEGTLVEGVSQNLWLLEGLEHSSWYQFFVRSNCNGEKSDWSMPFRFATECQAFDIPYTEDFNDVLTPEIPLCWTATGEGNYSVQTGIWSSDNQVVGFYSSGFDPGISTAMLVTPELNAELDKLVLTFTARHQWGFTAFHVGTVSDPYDIAGFHHVATVETGWDDWEEYTVEFSGYEGDHRYIAFMYGNYEAGGGQANIMDVEIDLVRFNISATAGDNGDMDPEGVVEVRYGHDQAFVVTAATGYHISELLVDGNVIAEADGESAYTYTFENVSGEHSISASFAINTYTISAMVEPEGGGTLTGDGEYEHGQTVSLSAVPSDGFEFVHWTEDSQEVSIDAVFDFTAESDRSFVAHFLDVSGVYEHGLMKAEIRVYPNPGNGMFRLDYIALEHGTIDLELINITGQVIYSRRYETTEMISEVIDLKHLGSGVYFLKISEPGKTGVIKLVFK